jgi:signal transduction histidine kinase/CBS domain-containing protein
MFSRTTNLTQVEITSAIIRSPLIVTPDTMVIEAIAQMSGVRNLCQASNAIHSELVYIEMRASCVIVIEDNLIVGILTERDVVRLITQKPTLENILIRDVMTRSVITLRESDFTDLFFAVSLLQQHHIRHLPLIDDRNCLTGLLTHESLRQTSRPADLLRLRLAKDVMTTDVVCAEPQVTMRAIARLMTDYQVSSVMILQPPVDLDQVALKIPIGIVTERDVVQFQALGLNLEVCLAQAVMSTPIFGVQPDDSLWVVQNLMEQRRIQRLAVIGTQSELLGIVTQSSLLQILNPLELYKLAEVLEDKVLRLEAEKIEILENRTIELEQQVEERTATLKAKSDQEYLIATVASQIRLSLDLPDILNTTVEKVRAVLGCDRVAIWQVQPNHQMLVVAESTSGKILPLLGKEVYDSCFAEYLATSYTYGYARIVPDIYTVEMTDCHRALLEQLQTRAKILIAIIEDGTLWGLLEAAESHKPRQWEPAAVDLLQQLATQLAIAIQQTTAYKHLQIELHERRLAEQRLEQLNAELERRVQERTVELQRMNQELARATRLKDEFLANMSHELRTPLNAILGMTEGLQEEIFGIVNEKQTKALNTVESSATHLLSLINDILDVAKIESGQIKLEHTSISVSHLFSSSLPFIKQLALQKQIQLETKLDEDLTNLLVDELRIRQVLINLLTNAVKFTREGGKVKLTAARLLNTDGLTSAQSYIRIAVIDNGIGITPDNINKLFRPFVQIDSTLNR